ncbi:hypothetical protein BDY21DRAFT_345077 [Lineolata rhizophorae]|uniref:Cora-like Mg2+ transporter protein-domain-containing protein n=1 Tax=Lineolata rhizophorae TaxID=578093 RepID=A0A6A6NZN7_9PEZI|nr:hypothetical protein BDY21DRAFT_345077 [Lineolata rhizophorae]
MASVLEDRSRLIQHSLFAGAGQAQNGAAAADDRTHYTHYQVYDVGQDGVPVLIEADKENTPKAAGIWHSIKGINADSPDRQAVGRITIAREPSAVLFGALHLTLNKAFNVDELFRHLVQSEASSAHMHRAFSSDNRKQRSFVFNLEYYTIIGEECQPMSWQLADKQRSTTDSHLPLSRCSSVIALSLYGEPTKKIRNPARRAKQRYGWAYSPWSPWQVVNIQCYPDWKASTDVHETSNKYLNGVEAFLATLLGEFRDAQKRFDEIYRHITKMITPPLDFIFNDELRDRRLFEDKDFTYTRRYFWASQTLAFVNDSIRAMIEAYEDTFTAEVWEGRSKSLWPLPDESPRNDFFRRRMRRMRLDFEREIEALREQVRKHESRRLEIAALRDQLFSGTSVLESRRTVELSEITIQQGHNIKLLTVVNIFFLPLTFVTSVFGMTNMPDNHEFKTFAIVMASVCIPFFLLIGTLNTNKGYDFFATHSRALWRFLLPKKSVEERCETHSPDYAALARSTSTEHEMALRLGREPRETKLDMVRGQAARGLNRAAEKVKEGSGEESSSVKSMDKQVGPRGSILEV